jgi:hypothetical protein
MRAWYEDDTRQVVVVEPGPEEEFLGQKSVQHVSVKLLPAMQQLADAGVEIDSGPDGSPVAPLPDLTPFQAREVLHERGPEYVDRFDKTLQTLSVREQDRYRLAQTVSFNGSVFSGVLYAMGEGRQGVRDIWDQALKLSPNA